MDRSSLIQSMGGIRAQTMNIHIPPPERSVKSVGVSPRNSRPSPSVENDDDFVQIKTDLSQYASAVCVWCDGRK
jgi:hypothetical protein